MSRPRNIVELKELNKDALTDAYHNGIHDGIKFKTKETISLIDGRIEGLRILFQFHKTERTTNDAELLYAIEELKIIRDCIKVG